MPNRNGDSIRQRIGIPLAIAVTVLWLASGFTALATDRIQVFLICTGPFGVLTGYVFGSSLFGRAENHATGRSDQ